MPTVSPTIRRAKYVDAVLEGQWPPAPRPHVEPPQSEEQHESASDESPWIGV